jgi:arylsulfatase A-like enzyme
LLLALATATLGVGASCRREPELSLVLVTVDTLRADRLGAYGSGLGLTPRLDALAEESVVFENAWAPAPFTLPSVSSIHTGLHPAQLPMRSNRSLLPADVTTLAERLDAAGFRSAAAVSNYILRSTTRLDRGFSVYDDRLTGREPHRAMPERTAAATTDAALAALDELGGARSGRFLWVHYQDPHGPYTPPESIHADAGPAPEGAADRTLRASNTDRGLGALPRYQRLGELRASEEYRARYHGEIVETDAEIGRLLDGLAERRILERAVVVFTADHGESLGEWGNWFAHGERCSAAELHVPLLIRAPGLASGRRSDPASLLDVAPTALGLLGVGPLEEVSGRDLFDGTGDAERILLLTTLDEALRPQLGVVRGSERYVVTRARAGSRRIADEWLGAATVDASELEASRRNLALEELRAALSALEHTRRSERPEERQSLGDLERERLQALGYLHEDSERER